MYTRVRRLIVPPVFLCAAFTVVACGRPSDNPDHVRGIVESQDSQVLTVMTTSGAVRVQLEPSTKVGTVVRSDREHIADGSFLGITSVTGSDGSERAVEVHVFPEAMRGSGEGSYAWDLPGTGGSGSKMTNGTAGTSRMTNGTVAGSKMTNGTLTAREGGSVLTVRYQAGGSSGAQTITIPPDIPVVAIEPGQTGDIRLGAHVFVVAHRNSDGLAIADRVLVGKDGVVPPM